MPAETDLAWAAGIFDGEGCLTLVPTPKRRRFAVRVAVGQKYSPVVKRLREIFGGDVGQYGTGRHRQWRWKVENLAAESVLQQVRPYLVLKGEQADLLLEFRQVFGGKKFSRWFPIPAENTAAQAVYHSRIKEMHHASGVS